MTVKIWEVPDGGLTDRLVTPLQTLSGHTKPVTLLHYHPTANNVIASAAKDPAVKVRRHAVACVRVRVVCVCSAPCCVCALHVLYARLCHDAVLCTRVLLARGTSVRCARASR
jgi:hypothetical protein